MHEDIAKIFTRFASKQEEYFGNFPRFPFQFSSPLFHKKGSTLINCLNPLSRFIKNYSIAINQQSDEESHSKREQKRVRIFPPPRIFLA
jgi:hypothetical protein